MLSHYFTLKVITCPWNISTNFFHDWPSTGNILVGPTVVETLLRFTKVRTSVAAHFMDRYRESLESALGRDDLKEYYRGRGGKVRHGDEGRKTGSNASLPSWVTSVRRSHDDRHWDFVCGMIISSPLFAEVAGNETYPKKQTSRINAIKVQSQYITRNLFLHEINQI